MANIKDFLMENVKPAESTREVFFERFKSPFVIQTITEKENDKLRKSNTSKRISRSGNRVADLNTDKYTDALLVSCVKVPDLQNAELQASYGTEADPAGTLKAMLLAGEYADLTQEVLNLNGFDDEGELKEEVKK